MERIKAFLETRHHGEIRARIVLDPEEGSYEPLPEGLDPRLKDTLRARGIDRLYSHQREAFDAISRGEHTLLVSRTASGKTLSFFLPVVNRYLTEKPSFSTLLLYPTKALSRDQESGFGPLLQGSGRAGRLGTFDGDTPREERDRIQKSGDFIITNPDMLHGGILPNHNRRWKTFLSRLRYVVVDEVHTYRGAFGSHVANVFRRLSRVCAMHGSEPVFICSSATVGNPADLARSLFHRDFTVIDRDGSPRPRREIYCMNPPLVRSQGHSLYRKGPGALSVPLIREALKLGIRAICFCRSRQEAERLYLAVIDGRPDLEPLVKPYRGGLLPAERRALERGLASGSLKGIITTNALELGIDIGDLELCVISGHPGTLASFWQQAGRVGRRGNNSLAVYIARETPIDQYLVHHPEFVTGAPVEQAWLSADNPYILLQHLPCAAQEYPLRSLEPLFDMTLYEESLRVLRENGTVVPFGEGFRYALQDYPSRGVNLRGMTDYNVEIYHGTEVIGEIDPIGARGTLYKDAIYYHLGREYMSLELDLEKKLCRVEPVEVDYYTDAVWEGRVVMTESQEGTEVQGARMEFGSINVNRQPKLYKKIRERTFENIGYGPITLPAFEYDTTGLSLLLPERWKTAVDAADRRFAGAALFGLRYIIRHAAPCICMGDTGDIDTDLSLVETAPGSWKSALFVFDSIEGGAGYAEKIYDRFRDVLTLAHRIISECECRTGCPSCVPPLPPGVDSEQLERFLVESDAAVRCTSSLLRFLLEGTVEVPSVTLRETELLPPVERREPDRERERLAAKLDRAAAMLQKKRERLH
ncbi:MAG: DEAD/DEAH box helicase [Spirochaetes bacterium]|nr:DEAD/DEAH box helicase [Spirochaetota bacterium]